jgi:SAM-dependent methyltransferase
MLDRARPLRLVATTVIRPIAVDRWEAAPSEQAPGCVELDGPALRLLSCFAEPATPDQASARFGPAPFDLGGAVATFVELGLLVDHEAARGQPPAPAYFEDYDRGPYAAHAVAGLPEALLEAVRAAGVAPSLEGLRVLDLGCATGHLVVALRAAGARAFGVELSRFALEHVVREAAPFVFRMDARELDLFPDAAFDLVVANLTPHIGAERMQPWLAGVARVTGRALWLRYVTQPWIDGFLADRGPEVAARMDLDWSRPDAWWRETFTAAGLRVLHERRDEDWDVWVLLGRQSG